MAGRHTQRARVLYQKTPAVAAQSSIEAFVQLDGDLVGSLPMSFESVPRALRVIAPH
jgi:diacylglycerol kinase family enzyme